MSPPSYTQLCSSSHNFTSLILSCHPCNIYLVLTLTSPSSHILSFITSLILYITLSPVPPHTSPPLPHLSFFISITLHSFLTNHHHFISYLYSGIPSLLHSFTTPTPDSSQSSVLIYLTLTVLIVWYHTTTAFPSYSPPHHLSFFILLPQDPSLINHYCYPLILSSILFWHCSIAASSLCNLLPHTLTNHHHHCSLTSHTKAAREERASDRSLTVWPTQWHATLLIPTRSQQYISTGHWLQLQDFYPVLLELQRW